MDLRFLYEFVVLADTGNFLEASEILFISQPTLSRHIKMLEDEIGKPLFDRTTRRVQLNSYGLMLSEYASEIINLYNQFMNRVQAESNRVGKDNSIVIGAIPAMYYYGMSEVFNKFRSENPDCSVNVFSAYSVSIAEKLRQQECEFTFMRARHSSIHDDKVAYIPFSSDRLVAFVNTQHPLAQKNEISLAELKEEKIISLPIETQVGEIIRGACMSVGFAPNITVKDHSVNHLTEYVRLGMGVGLLMDKHLNEKYTDMHDLRVLEVTPKISSYIFLSYMKNVKLSHCGKAFLEMFLENFVGYGWEEKKNFKAEDFK